MAKTANPKKSKTTEIENSEEFDFFKIDIYNLHEEWRRQPQLMFEYAVKLRRAERSLAEAKAELDITKADVARDIRAKPRKYNVTEGSRGITEAAIAEALRMDEEVQQAVQDVADAEYNVGVMRAAVEALQHRKAALENEVVLHGRDYYSDPRIKGEDGKKGMEKVKEANEFGRGRRRERKAKE